MNKKKKLIAAIVLLVLLFALVGALMYVINSRSQPVTILYFSRNIQYDDNFNYSIVESDIVEGEILASDLKADQIVAEDKASVIGKYILAPGGVKGNPILKSQLSAEPTNKNTEAINSDKQDMRIIYLQVDMDTAFAGNISKGEKVDLLFTDQNSGFPMSVVKPNIKNVEDNIEETSAATVSEDGTETTSEETAATATSKDTKSNVSNGTLTVNRGSYNNLAYAFSEIFMTGLYVENVYTAEGKEYIGYNDKSRLTANVYNGENINGEQTEQEAPGAPKYVSLSVNAEQYEEIIARMQMGKVTLVKRYPGSSDSIETDGYTTVRTDGAGIITGKGTLEYDLATMPEYAGAEFIKEAPATSARPSAYAFIKELSRVSMTDAQREAYTNIYTEYADLMTIYGGEDWELNSPESVKLKDINEYLRTNDAEKLNQFMSFKTNFEALAKELRGQGVYLPE